MGLVVKIIWRTIILTVALATASAAARADDATGPLLVFDPFSGEVIQQQRAGEPWYPASLTKLMTSYLIFKKLQAGTMTLDQKLTISDLAHSQPASHTGLPAGRQ